MRTIKWRKKCGTDAIHCLYTREEAERLGMSFKDNWRDGRLGDWVLTDDGAVVQIIRCYRETDHGRLITTPTMTCDTRRQGFLDTKKKKSRWTISQNDPHAPPKTLTTKIVSMCAFIATGMRPEDAYVLAYHGGEKISQEYLKLRVKSLMASEVVRQELVRTLGDKLDQAGLTIDFVLLSYKNVIDSAENDGARVAALNKISSFHGLDGKTPEAPPLPAIPQAMIDKLGDIAKGEIEPEPVVAEVVPEQEIVEAEITEEVSDEAEGSDDDFVGGFTVYRGAGSS